MQSTFGISPPAAPRKTEQSTDPAEQKPSGQTHGTGFSRAVRLTWAVPLLILGRILTLSCAFVFLLTAPTFSLNLVELFARGLLILGCITGLKLTLVGRRYSKVSARTLLAKDIRDPVIYLRTFHSDLQTTDFDEYSSSLWQYFAPSLDWLKRFPVSSWRLLASLFRLVVAPPRTEEEQLENALKSFGPAVAVGRPGEALPPVGLPRLHLDPVSWQEDILALVRRARLVVVRCGSSRKSDEGYWPTYHSETISSGLGWEIRMAVKEVSPEKLILLSPFNGIEYADFCSKVKGIFPKGLPAWVESSPDTGTILSVTWFDKDWNAQLAPVTWIDTSWRLDTRYPLGRALKEKFEAIRCEKRTLLDDVAIACKRVIASAWDALLVTSLLFILFISANKGSLQSLEQKVQHAPIFASALLLIGLILYQTLFEASGQMATLGKRSVGLLAVDMSSGPLTLIVSLKRALLKALLFPITWISLLFGSRATLHEHLSKTLVTNRAIRMREPAHFPFAASGWLFSLSTFVFLVWIVAVHGPRPDLSPLHFPNGSQSVTLDAANVGEDPLLEVKIKGQHLVFLFGTRSGNCVIDRRTAASLHLKTQPRKVNVFEGVGTTLHEVTERVTLGLGAANLVEPGLVISDLSRAEGIIGKRIDGVIGYTLLKTAVVTVNYETGKITLTNPKSFDYRGNGIVVPLSIHNGWASANATLKAHGLEPSQSEYWINTDLKIALTSPTFSGTTNFIPLGSRGPAYPQSKLAIPVGQFESIAIGNLRIEHLDMPCCARTTLGESQIGNGLLKRFVVIFDYTRQRLILERLHPEDETILTEKAGTEQHEIPRNNPEPRIPVAMKGTTAAGSAFPKANLVPKAPRSQKDSVPAPIVDPQHQAELERLAQVADKNSIWTGYPNCKVILGSLEVSPTPSSLETIDRIQCGESLEVLGKESKFYLVRTKRNILGYVVANAVSQSQ